jgi:hypothetical protein
MARHAVFAVNLLGVEVLDPVQGDQVTAVELDIILKNLAALHLAEDVFEQGADMLRAHLVEDGPHLRITGNALQVEDRVKVMNLDAFLELQEGAVLETEESQTGRQGVG